VNRISERVPSALLLVPPILLIIGFLLVPVIHLFTKGLSSALMTTEVLPSFFWPHLLRVTQNTFTLGILTTFISLLAALPLAFVLVRTDIAGSRVWLSLLTIPMITPPFIMAFAVLSIYGRSGLISLLLQRLGMYLPHIFGLRGMLINQLIVSIPYATFIIAAGLQGVPRHVDESAVSLGSSHLQILLRVTVPCIAPHIIISGLMIFLMAVGDIGGPLVIGGGYTVLSYEIYTNFLSVLNDERVALIFSLWVIILSLVLLTLVNRLLRATTREYQRGVAPVVYRLGRWNRVTQALVALVFLFLLAPFFVTVVQSFVTIWGYRIIPSGWTLENYARIFTYPSMLMDTARISLTATIIIVVFALILGDRIYFKKRFRFLDYILIIPFILPGIVLAVGVLSAYAGIFPRNHPVPFYLLLLFTIVARRLPYSLKTMEAGFLVADKRREEVSRSLGASQLKSFFMITLPQLKTFVFAAFIIGIVKTSTELSASLILAPADWQSLSLGIVHYIDQGSLPLASAMSVLLIFIIGIGTSIVAFWSHAPIHGDSARQSQEALERLVLGRTPAPFNGPKGIMKRRNSVNLYRKPREPFLVCVDTLGITEANAAFLKLVGADTLGQLKAESSFSMVFFGDREVLEIFSSMETIENRATSLMTLEGGRVPILLTAYIVQTAQGHRKAVFYCRKVTGHSRRVQEYNRLKERMTLAEQMALKAQITPHFLFNSLNSVMDLIDTNPSEANRTLQSLADLYRYILSSTKVDSVPVFQEIEAVRHYLQVEKSRFSDKLTYTIDVDEALEQCEIPPMLLQPVVENAVTHGAKETGEIDISIRLYRAKENLIISIEDNGDSVFDPVLVATGKGTGLKNVEGRLFAMYHRRIGFENKKGGGLVVTMAVPIDSL